MMVGGKNPTPIQTYERIMGRRRRCKMWEWQVAYTILNDRRSDQSMMNSAI
jgi:hypothetical protein